MPNIPDFSIEVGLFGVQVLCYGALTTFLQKILRIKRSTECEQEGSSWIDSTRAYFKKKQL